MAFCPAQLQERGMICTVMDGQLLSCKDFVPIPTAAGIFLNVHNVSSLLQSHMASDPSLLPGGGRGEGGGGRLNEMESGGEGGCYDFIYEAGRG
jgi:hypothetical protein